MPKNRLQGIQKNYLIDECGDRVKLQKFAVISIGFDRLLYKKF
jgi:hypothetical protein